MSSPPPPPPPPPSPPPTSSPPPLPPPPPYVYNVANTSSAGYNSNNPETWQEPADDYLCLAIFSCIFLNLILGIIAIVFSYKTRKANQREDYETANKNSKTTLYVIIAAAIVGVITAILSLVLGV
ncbi:hypothetical protein C0Q70_16753 [Pomacea canaliculata]|uniref:Uncharacterized protein n=1 Tax=Pomacea canaliculata TaxID=400727 RepID=A0A2T7NQN4_POMCA|nr:protein enabled homolog [Pomacea canaliculata]XP_025109786.1 protein enabled homolog [Pomacea canaliculata]XP_025109787.1 protein enabled homolog [Pomacea canaliculata]PVD23481.1 hypothetical protein C0Q70_16753 [Pomacea canaliculata]